MNKKLCLIANVCWLTLCSIYANADADQPMLMWSSERPSVRTSGIYAASAIPERQREYRGYILSSRIVSLKLPHFIAAFDSNDAKRQIAIMDVGRGNLAVVSTNSRSILRSHRGITNKAHAIAIDWKSGNIYWSDQGGKWIFVSTANFRNLKPVVGNVRFPRGIALYPQKGLLFWSQLAEEFGESKIMKATLSGERPEVVAAVFGVPLALALDYSTDIIYWIDVSDMAIRYNSINGNSSQSELLYQNSSMSFKDLHVFRDWVYVTAESEDQILMLNKTSGKVLHTINTHSPTAVSVAGGGAQPIQPGPCDIKNGGCEQFCFAQPPGNRRKCGCSLGMNLGPDGTSCRSNIMKKNFFIVVDSDMQWIFQVSADGKRLVKLNLPGVSIPVQAEYDPVTTRVYWTDIGTNSVNRANLDGSNHVVMAKKNVRQPTGIALDRYSSNLYWTDEGTGTINVIRTDGSHHKTLISKGVKLPRGLALDPASGYMWWSDWKKNTIERAAMDGTKREVIIDSDVDWVNGLAVDFANNRLYWCDAKKDTIETANLDGQQREVVKKLDSSRAHVFGITSTKDYIYWTDWNQPTLLRMRKDDDSKSVETFGPHIFDKPSDIHAFVGEDSGSLNDTNPCQISNGNCTGLCIPVPKNITSMNDVSDSDDIVSYLSTRVCLCGNEYNGTCDKPTEGIDGIAPSFGRTCPVSMTFTAPPCESAVLVNYTRPTATDNSGNVTVEDPLNPPPVNLTEGLYDHRYTAIDEAGNHATCHFTITVKVIRCEPAKEYLANDPVKVEGATCGNLFGSRVRLECPNATDSEEAQYMECDHEGEWDGDYFCPAYPSEIQATPETTTQSVAEITEESKVIEESTQAPTTSGNSTLSATTSSIKIRPSQSPIKGGFPFEVVLPVVAAIIIIIFAAICFRYYRSNSIPLMAAMEKTMSYNKNDNADTFTLDVDKGRNATDTNQEQRQETTASTQQGNHRRGSLPMGAQTNSACNTSQDNSTDSTAPRLSNYGTIP